MTAGSAPLLVPLRAVGGRPHENALGGRQSRTLVIFEHLRLSLLFLSVPHAPQQPAHVLVSPSTTRRCKGADRRPASVQ